jgi:hypothetical protein
MVWSTLPVLALSALAMGPYRESMPVWVDNLAQLGAVVSMFILVCAFEAGSGGMGRGGST